MPRFEPFPALRYSSQHPLEQVVAPPYDVLSPADVDTYASRDNHNIVHIDVPVFGEDRYVVAAQGFRRWMEQGFLQFDDEPCFTIYRMRFTDESGRHRDLVGVLGALEVVDQGAGGVLPHERTTPKASTDRLDLTRATKANLSPVWGLSLTQGLSKLLTEPGEPLGSVVVGGVEHVVERVSDPDRVAAIASLVRSDDVLIADGHHRYGVARIYRDEVRATTRRTDTPAELTLAFVSELSPEQLSIDGIHRVYRGVGTNALETALSGCFDLTPAWTPTPATLQEMEASGRLVFLRPDGSCAWLTPKPGAFDDVRSLDGAWLEHATEGLDVEVTYQHGLDQARELIASEPSPDGRPVPTGPTADEYDPRLAGVVLVRPPGIDEIERTAREGLLMPPKSTFFTPKLLTGLVMRVLSDV